MAGWKFKQEIDNPINFLSNALVIAFIVIIFLGLIILIFFFAGNTLIQTTKETDYYLRNLVKDAAEVSLAIGALIAGLIGIYKYWYSEYVPLVYFVSCGLINKTIIDKLYNKTDKNFSNIVNKVLHRKDTTINFDDSEYQTIHDLPVIILHNYSFASLGLNKQGEKVDLLFKTPDDKAIWAVAYAFSYESIFGEKNRLYKDWPIGLSLSLRRYFRIEKPCSGKIAEYKREEGWKLIKKNNMDLARLNVTDRNYNCWFVSDEYSCTFRDPNNMFKYFSKDDEDNPMVLEYSGISLRIMKRSLFRYRESYE